LTTGKGTSQTIRTLQHYSKTWKRSSDKNIYITEQKMLISGIPCLPKLERSSTSTTRMLCDTAWTSQLSWDMHHSHKQIAKSKSVTNKNGA